MENSLLKAKEKKEKYFFTGKPCKYGHVDKRLSTNGTCFTCFKIKRPLENKKYRKTHKDRIAKYFKDYAKKYEKELKEYRDNRKERTKELQKLYRQRNPKRSSYDNSLRRARKKNATPPWADLKKIKEIYMNCPDGYVVDHIIPFKNHIVCGLHVENNLQYLTPLENGEKKNKFESIHLKSTLT